MTLNGTIPLFVADGEPCKPCWTCGEIKSLEEFYRHPLSRDKRQWHCKDCQYPEGKKKRERDRLRKRGIKPCSICKQIRPFGDFHRCSRNVDGRDNRCKDCANSKKRGKPRNLPEVPTGMKWCSCCKKTKRSGDFRNNRNAWDGLSGHCAECQDLSTKMWQQRNPERYRAVVAAARRRRERLEQSRGQYRYQDWLAMTQYYENTCLKCGSREETSPDHVVPLSRGGANEITNLQPLCLSCNKRKHAKTADYRDPYLHSEFLKAIGAYD